MPATSPRVTRRTALKGLAAGFAAPAVFRAHATAAPSETVLFASFGAGGRAWADINEMIAGSKHAKLVAVADVDQSRFAEVKKHFPDVRVYADWRVLLDTEKDLHAVNVSTPDHMHAPIMVSAMQRGLHVYGQKPLTQTIAEARLVTKLAAEKKLVTQMGIQIHSHAVHKTAVALIRAGAVGKVKEVHSWSGKQWGDANPRPERTDPVPAGLNWDHWTGVAAERPYLAGYYHPGNWRKRLDFGCGTFGDMGCHILDPVFDSLGVTNPITVRSELPGPNADSWALDARVKYVFPGTPRTTDTVSVTWTNGGARPPADIVKRIAPRKLHDQGSIYVGTEGVLYAPYIAAPVLLPEEKFKDYKLPELTSDDHYRQFVEAVRGNGTPSAPFSYAGPLTEMVLLGCLATRFPNVDLAWDAAKLTFTNHVAANAHVSRAYRKGWEVPGL